MALFHVSHPPWLRPVGARTSYVHFSNISWTPRVLDPITNPFLEPSSWLHPASILAIWTWILHCIGLYDHILKTCFCIFYLLYLCIFKELWDIILAMCVCVVLSLVFLDRKFRMKTEMLSLCFIFKLTFHQGGNESFPFCWSWWAKSAHLLFSYGQ